MKPKTDIFIPIYIGDMLKDTTHLRPSDFGSYHYLIYAYWTRRWPLPDDDEQLRSIARCSLAQWRKVKPILSRFFQVGEGVWRHKRIEIELEKAAIRLARSRRANEVRWRSKKPGFTGSEVSLSMQQGCPK